MTIDHPNTSFNAWEDYEETNGVCKDCLWTGQFVDAILELETELISSLHCPLCDLKLALISNEASHHEIHAFAKAGSQKAKIHVDQCSECQTKN